MTKTLAELDQALADLEAKMPDLLHDTRVEDQMEAFASLANEITNAASTDHQEHVWGRLQCMLRDAGLVPGDDEPCSDA